MKGVFRTLLVLCLFGLAGCVDLTAPRPEDDGSDKGPDNPKKELVGAPGPADGSI